MNIQQTQTIGDKHSRSTAGRLTLALVMVQVISLTPLDLRADQADQSVTIPTATNQANELTGAEKEERRALMENAIRKEKLKMRTEAQNRDNQRRSAGEILKFDVFLGVFLTMLWSLISVFIASYFRSEAPPLTKRNSNSGLKIFYAAASLLPMMLLWVAISTGYNSWWLTFAISATLFGLFGALYGRIANTNLKRI